jgi:hypothetical protein
MIVFATRDGVEGKISDPAALHTFYVDLKNSNLSQFRAIAVAWE